MSKELVLRIQQRADTAAAWEAANPVLLHGEIGYATDTRVMKVGDGTTPWNDLIALSASELSALETRVKAIESDYLVAADKEALEKKITEAQTAAEETASKALTTAKEELEGKITSAEKAATDAVEALTEKLYGTDDETSGEHTDGTLDALGAKLVVDINETEYRYVFGLYNSNGRQLGLTYTIDLPLESVVVDGEYNSETKCIDLTLDTGKVISIPAENIVGNLAKSSDVVTLQGQMLEVQGDITTLKTDTTAAQTAANNAQNTADAAKTAAATAQETAEAAQTAANNAQNTADAAKTAAATAQETAEAAQTAANNALTKTAADLLYDPLGAADDAVAAIPAAGETAGLMSADDKEKLDGIAEGATRNTDYSLPLAADGTRGGVQLGAAESNDVFALKLTEKEQAYVEVTGFSDAKQAASDAKAGLDKKEDLLPFIVEMDESTGKISLTPRE